jgi:hypothetical protein
LYIFRIISVFINKALQGFNKSYESLLL